jgi:hypothetical protein
MRKAIRYDRSDAEGIIPGPTLATVESSCALASASSAYASASASVVSAQSAIGAMSSSAIAQAAVSEIREAAVKLEKQGNEAAVKLEKRGNEAVAKMENLIQELNDTADFTTRAIAVLGASVAMKQVSEVLTCIPAPVFLVAFATFLFYPKLKSIFFND